MKSAIRIDDIATVALRLEPLREKCVFTGGAIIGLLMDDPALVSIRPTKDVDVIVEVRTRIHYADLEGRLRGLGFKHAMSEGAPKCRWIIDNIRVDIMPVTDQTGELSDTWFELALRTATKARAGKAEIWMVTAPCLVATKLETFIDRGKGDFMASHDIEDLLAVIDGREALVEEIAASSADLRHFIADKIAELLGNMRFLDSLPGHLPPDDASQRRLPIVHERLRAIAALATGSDS
ncbi:MAG: hypothetical protein PHN82_04770 [bacterium]|nr:hypothetical protein [bacterium]